MRFLFLSTRYSSDASDPYLTDELAGELISRGHSVDVLLLDWDSQVRGDLREVSGRHGERIVTTSPRSFGWLGKVGYRASRLLLSSRHAAKILRTQFDLKSYDAVIAWTPALAFGSVIRRGARLGIRHRLLIVFDFFPICQLEAGIFRSRLVFAVAKALEDGLFRTFTAIIANLPGNATYLRRNYPVSPRAKVYCSPIWADSDVPPLEPRRNVRQRLGLDQDRPIAIFGGQLSEGRGLEQLICAAELGEQRGDPTLYLFVGDGRLRPLIEKAARRCSTIKFMPPVPRSDYLSIVAACDVGMVATVREFTSWAFPSKTIDYLRAGIPLVTAVEPGSDYPALLKPYRISLNVEAGDAEAFQAAVATIVHEWRDRERIADSARACLEDVFDVTHAADTVLRAVGVPKSRRADQTKATVMTRAVTA